VLYFWRDILKGKIKYILVFTVISVFFTGNVLGGDSLTQKQKELKDIKQQLNTQKVLLEQAKEKEHNLVKEINTLDQEIEIISERISSLEKHLNQVLVLKKEAERRLMIAQNNLKSSRERLGEKVFFIYRYGNVSYLELLLGASDPYNFLTRYRFLSKLAEEDAILIKSVQEEMENVKKWKIELNNKEKDIKDTRNELLKQKDSLTKKKEERNRLLAKTSSERAEYEKALRELEESSRTLETLIKRLQQTAKGPGLVGNLFWPTNNRLITSQFGHRRHPIWGIDMFHSGIDIAGNYGDNIYAVSDGRVIYSGWQSGYGKVLIIDHGNGMSTLYGHCSQLLVNEGATVKKGQIIGKVGSTGWSTGPHLHFEVRKNGSPINPLSMIK